MPRPGDARVYRDARVSRGAVAEQAARSA